MVEFKPVLYRRYVDDIFILFRSESHIEPFFQYINTRHTRIKFTVEKEKDDSLSFLDVLIKKLDNKFTTDIYRKPTFSGQCLRFDSSVNEQYKINFISCLLDRPFKICSSSSILCTEISRLRKKYFVKIVIPIVFSKLVSQTDLNLILVRNHLLPQYLKIVFFVKFPLLIPNEIFY